MNNLALLDLIEGRLDEARAKLEEILPIDRKMGRPAVIATRLGGLSRVLFQQGDINAAEKINDEECAILQSIKAKADIAACHVRQAEIAWTRSDTAKAQSIVESVVSELKATSVPPGNLANLAVVQLSLGNAAAAAQTIEMARKSIQSRAFDPDESAGVAIAEARIEGVGSHRTALSKLMRAQSDAQKFGLTLRIFEARLAAAEIQSRQGNTADAANLAREATESRLALFAMKARSIGSTTLRASGLN